MTTFYFVTEGFDAAYSAACRAAGNNGVDIAGGASTVRQALVAGVIDEPLVMLAIRVRRRTWSACRPREELASSQWTVSWLWHISTYFAMRAARVSGFFAS